MSKRVVPHKNKFQSLLSHEVAMYIISKKEMSFMILKS